MKFWLSVSDRWLKQWIQNQILYVTCAVSTDLSGLMSVHRRRKAWVYGCIRPIIVKKEPVELSTFLVLIWIDEEGHFPFSTKNHMHGRFRFAPSSIQKPIKYRSVQIRVESFNWAVELSRSWSWVFTIHKTRIYYFF